MFGALSDVLDWLAALPWEALGIGGAIVAAVVASLHFGHVMLIAWHRRKRREKLGGFLREGQGLQHQCGDETSPLPEDEAEDWAERTEAYLEKHLGSDYVASFRSGAGLPMVATPIGPQARLNLWSAIMVRLARLQQFLEELRR